MTPTGASNPTRSHRLWPTPMPAFDRMVSPRGTETARADTGGACMEKIRSRNYTGQVSEFEFRNREPDRGQPRNSKCEQRKFRNCPPLMASGRVAVIG